VLGLPSREELACVLQESVGLGIAVNVHEKPRRTLDEQDASLGLFLAASASL
jgi:hypothetical protein